MLYHHFSIIAPQAELTFVLPRLMDQHGELVAAVHIVKGLKLYTSPELTRMTIERRKICNALTDMLVSIPELILPTSA